MSSVIDIGSIAGITAAPVDTFSYNVSKAGAFMTGQIVAVDGGTTLVT